MLAIAASGSTARWRQSSWWQYRRFVLVRLILPDFATIFSVAEHAFWTDFGSVFAQVLKMPAVLWSGGPTVHVTSFHKVENEKSDFLESVFEGPYLEYSVEVAYMSDATPLTLFKRCGLCCFMLFHAVFMLKMTDCSAAIHSSKRWRTASRRSRAHRSTTSRCDLRPSI